VFKLRSRYSVLAFVRLGLAGLIGLTMSGVTVMAADTWTNLAGTSSVSGELLGMWNGRVLLKLEGGRRVSVAMNDLRAESRIQAERRFEEMQRRIVERRDEIRLIAEEESAAAPTDLAGGFSAPDAPEYRAVAANQDLQQTLTGIRDQLLAGHPRVFYDTLPDSQRTAFDRWFGIAVRKVDAGSYDSARRTLATFGELIVSRQRWLFSHPQFAALASGSEGTWLATGAALRDLFSDEVTGVERLRTTSIPELLAGMDDAIAPVLYQAFTESGLAAMAPDIQATPGQDGGTTASLVLPVIGSIGSVVGYPQDGGWIWWGDKPEAAAARWQQWTEALEAIPDDSLPVAQPLGGLLGQLDQSLAGLMAASNRQHFHQQLDEALPQWLAMFQQGLGVLGAPQGVAGGPAGGMMPGMPGGGMPGGGMGAGGMPMPGMPTMPSVPGMPGMPGMGGGAPGMGGNPMGAGAPGDAGDGGFVEP